MEVHHHPNVEKKNFKEYVLEFLMIFLAVTMGFFAESLREHFADLASAHEYLETYQQELKHNKETIGGYERLYSVAMIANDSMAMLFYNKKENEDLSTTNRLFSKARKIAETTLDDAAYQQLINSGGLKYIHNAQLKDSMAHYSSEIQNFFNYNQIKYSDRSASLPEVNSLDDIHDWTSPTKVLQMDPYLQLSARERRFMVSFYRQSYVLSADERRLSFLDNINKNLLKMVQDELNK